MTKIENSSQWVIAGFDPGLLKTGYGVVTERKANPRELRCIEAGVITTSTRHGSMLERIQFICQSAVDICARHGITHVCIEDWAFQGRIVTGHANYSTNRVIGALAMLGLAAPYPSVHTQDALRWGRQLTGIVGRSKADVAQAVSMRLGERFSAKGGGHLTDGLGLAITLYDLLKAGRT